MKGKACHKVEKCPIFNEGIMMSERTGETFKKHYCLNTERYETCKRFQASKLTANPIPTTILPNSRLSVDEILLRVNAKN